MSNIDKYKPQLTQLVIAAGVVFGCNLFLVQPRQKTLDQLQFRISSLKSEINDMDKGLATDAASVEEKLVPVRELAREVIERNETFSDVTSVYDVVTGLADKCNLSLGPFSPQQHPGSDSEASVLSVRITATGQYDQLARYIHLLSDTAGFNRTVELSVQPLGDELNKEVRATIHMEFLTFDIPKALTSLVEASDE